MQLRGARNRHDPRLLREQPCKRDLSRRDFLRACEFADQIDEDMIRHAVLLRETWDDVAKIVFIELRFFVDLAGEKALAERTEWDKANAQFIESGNHFRFRLPPP